MNVMEQTRGKYSVAQSPSGIPSPSYGVSSGSESPERRLGLSRSSSFHNRPRSGSHHGMLEPAFRPADIDNPEEKKHLWELMSTYLSKDIKDIQQYICNHIEYTLARTRYNLDKFAVYQATSLSVRDRLIESWNDTQQWFTQEKVKRVYYMSLEFLMGRSLANSLFNLDLTDEYKQALGDFGRSLEEIYEEENDAALGNGGLGRLAACFLDSMATLNIPAWGYGIRYNYGMFSQRIVDGYQVEHPDYWLTFGNPWEIERLDVSYPVYFGGHVTPFSDEAGNWRVRWEGDESVFAVAYDTPIPGYDTWNTLNMRLWSSKPPREFDLDSFNSGDYINAIEARRKSEGISHVLYPNDNTLAGKELRLRQQYFFSSATLQDIIRRFKKTRKPLTEMHTQVAIQLNDTHPSISIPELMRLLVDQEFLGWDEAWNTVTNVFAFTNHTVLPEALERWPVPLMESLLPRHMQIIYEINYRFLQDVEAHFPSEPSRLGRMSIIEEGDPKFVRMAFLALVGSHSVNGVAEIHSEILKAKVFKDFYDLWPEKFNNVTNGVTPRRWMALANPAYSEILSTFLETEDWIVEMSKLRELEMYVEDAELHNQFWSMRHENKERLAMRVEELTGITIDSSSMFDVQIKRIHEYKRQFMNILSVIYRWHRLKTMSARDREETVKRTVMIGGKAAPGYMTAKRIIKLITSVGAVINNDPETSDYLKVVFLPNYNVSLAELIIPATDLSQHISTAGTEASGTSNMKFAMNGALILGTMDGANIEIAQEIDISNMFIFGAEKDEVDGARERLSSGEFVLDSRLQTVLDLIRDGTFGHVDYFEHLLGLLDGARDYYLLSYDFADYLEAQDAVDLCYKNSSDWVRKSLLSTARMGKFSSDRSISEYATKIWNVEPCARPDPYDNPNVPTNFPVASKRRPLADIEEVEVTEISQ